MWPPPCASVREENARLPMAVIAAAQNDAAGFGLKRKGRDLERFNRMQCLERRYFSVCIESPSEVKDRETEPRIALVGAEKPCA